MKIKIWLKTVSTIDFVGIIMNFVLIHIGINLRDHINDCIDQIRLTNPAATVWVLVNRMEVSKVRSTDVRIADARIVELESIPIMPKHRLFQERYRSPHSGPLWRFSTERFFYLETFMAMTNLKQVIHMEYDNMIYMDMSNQLPIFTSKYANKIGCTFDADTRGIAGLLYVDSVEPMSAFTDFILSDAKLNKTDMDYLVLFKDFKDNKGQNGKEWIAALPIISPNYGQNWTLKNDLGHTTKHPSVFSHAFEDFKCIFDAAAMGQYLGGIDPIHNRPDSIGFINETCVFQCNKVAFEWVTAENGRRFPWMICGEERIPIANLHIHCKNLAAFRS